MSSADIVAGVERRIDCFQEGFAAVRSEIAKVIVGCDAVIDGVLVALVAGGHVLLEGIPGLGKTSLVHALSQAVDVTFSRIQFTPDLMPADVTGTSVVVGADRHDVRIEFQPGPIFANVLLADEINRATPKTQSALLEAMQEKKVTVGSHTHVLAEPFVVLATQNPIEMEGTYRLPEAQLDRFFYNLHMPYPGVEELHAILDRTTRPHEPYVTAVLDGAALLDMRSTALAVPIARPVQEYAIRLVMATRPESAGAPPMVKQYVRYGASPRGAQAMVVSGKILALLAGRVHVSCEDIRAAMRPTLRHRVLLNFEGEAENVRVDTILDDVRRAVREPAE